jgi:pimeloyl-ACP methyl ester carboxylesterase
MSDRLGAHPERFFWGAIQSFWDIVDLARIVREDKHPHLAPDTRFDFVGFSAGGFVALALLLENTEGLFAGSRATLFATCAAVRDMSLSSHLIVDQMAEIALMNLYVKYQQKLSGPRILHWMTEHSEGRWFNGFCGLRPDRQLLETRLREIASRLHGIANVNDQVIPCGGMFNALQGVRRDIPIPIDELDLGIHENPFASGTYDQRDRSIMTEFLNRERYGSAFERFIEITVDHLSR